jgi:hypothetical protein
VFFEYHFLKKPGGVGYVPLWGGYIDARLGNVILDLERFTQVFGVTADAAVELAQTPDRILLGMCAMHETIRANFAKKAKRFYELRKFRQKKTGDKVNHHRSYSFSEKPVRGGIP